MSRFGLVHEVKERLHRHASDVKVVTSADVAAGCGSFSRPAPGGVGQGASAFALELWQGRGHETNL
ncbi:hypothetical protein [Bacillus songklensis]